MRERRNARGRFFIFIVIVGLAAYVFRDTLFAPNPYISAPVSQTSSQAAESQNVVVTRLRVIDIDVTATPYPTPMPLPTYTPQPTYTPLPTLEPIIIVPTPIIVNVAGDYGQGGKYDQLYLFWVPRFFALFFLVITPIVLLVTFYKIKTEKNKMDHAERMKAIDLERIKAEPDKRTVMVNNGKRTDPNYVITANGSKIQKVKVMEFILNYRDIGLSINQWKESDSPIHQHDIEKILDHLENLGLITSRANGIAAEWKREVDMLRLCRYFSVSMEELGNYEKSLENKEGVPEEDE